MKPTMIFTTLIVMAALAAPFESFAVDAERQAEVAQRGAEVMPFSLKATTHIFTKSDDGGNQQVIAKNPSDSGQIRLIRKHLREIQTQFERGDFSGPARTHGTDMPGLAQLRAAKLGQISITYKDIKGGGELTYRSDDPKLVSSLHAWFDAQLTDHGADAMNGHMHHHAETPPP
ncbi:aspartate carbamoyltransferase [Paraburkholderia strydomiana]|uniref:aspartate carbamoyltransferase n=1 Tax=Paraburkholderia strydomiana TaxID=1245417 RepID=UPI0038BCA693